MIDNTINKMTELVSDLKHSISLDMKDVRNAKHESLLNRNDKKHQMIEEITNLKLQLNQELLKAIEEGVDVNIYRVKVDELEVKLKELYTANKKLASVVLPVQQLYKDLVEDITLANGGQIFDLKA